MGLRCLFGHDFGDREVERERHEDGEELVVVYRTVETCSACGSRRVVSENKEVRSMREVEAAASEPATDDEATGASTPEPSRDPEPTPTASGAGAGDGSSASFDADDAGGVELIDEAESGSDAADGPAEPDIGAADEASPEAAGSTGGEAPVGEPDADEGAASDDDPALAEEDAVVITETTGGDEATADDGSTAGDRDDGAGDRGDDAVASDDGATLVDASATEATTGGVGGFGDWPETPGEDEGVDATPHASTDADVSFGGGLTPEPPEASGTSDRRRPNLSDGSAFVDDGDATVVRPTRRAVEDAATEFGCPNCGATAPADGSLRAGDVCPECRKGYVAERAE